MDELISSSNAASGALDHYALFGEEGQRRAQEFLAAQHAQLERLEAELVGHVESLAVTLGGSPGASSGAVVSDEALEAENLLPDEKQSVATQRSQLALPGDAKQWWWD